VYLRLKALEAEIERWKRWDGRFPSTLTQVGDGKAGLLVTTPSAPPATPAAAARP
jgi:hypothetical protein